jgi:hypothetical protein
MEVLVPLLLSVEGLHRKLGDGLGLCNTRASKTG